MTDRRQTVEDWRRAVYRDPHISDATRVLLLMLADEMTPTTLKVSVSREVLARRLGRSERRVSERFSEAFAESPAKSWKWTEAEQRCRHGHRLLDRVVRGQKHVQAVYQALVPDLSVTHVCPTETPISGAASHPAENAESAHIGLSAGRTGVPPYKRPPVPGGPGETSGNEEQGDPWPRSVDPPPERESA